jgi:outer membrane immunogenic protein
LKRIAISIGAAATVALATPALAADLTNVEPLPTPPAAVQAAPANNWTGFYLGVLGGYGWADADTNSAAGDVNFEGFDIGGYGGANWQWGNFVLGGEADLVFPWRDGSEAGLKADQELNGSLRARAGIALDRFLLYGTAGLAGTELELSSAAGKDENELWGWTAGAGVEGMITNNISARVEYRFTDYDDETFNLGGANVKSDLQTNTIRGGIGFKF